MNSRFTVVETSLNRAEFRWKGLRLLQHSFLLGGILCLLTLLFGGAMALGWVTSKTGATAFFAFVAAAGFITWAIIIISVVAGFSHRNRLAAPPQPGDPRLMDRPHNPPLLERPP